MKNLIYYSIIHVAFLTFFVNSVNATETERKCFSCEAIQHAANLTAIEKHLQQSNPQIVSELDEEAREWFAKFQKGGMFFDGWKEISADVVENVPVDNKIPTKITMLALGVRIGCEWSKDNDIRKISTTNLKEWGSQLRETVDERPAKISQVIQNIELEVDTLLAVRD